MSVIPRYDDWKLVEGQRVSSGDRLILTLERPGETIPARTTGWLWWTRTTGEEVVPPRRFRFIGRGEADAS